MSRQHSPCFDIDDESDTFLSGDVLNKSIDNDTSEDDTAGSTGIGTRTRVNGIVGSPSTNSLASSCSTATRQHRPGSVLDEKGFRLRAGCIALKYWGSDTRLLLTASTRHKGQWVLPAGGVEKGESSRQAAIREAQEEAGVDCDELEYLGDFDDELKQTRTSMWIGIAGDITKNVEGRNVAWFSLEEAGRLYTTKLWQQRAIAAAKKLLIDKYGLVEGLGG
eukprot:gb/GECG01006045.1/.p1 GENE.gb/GECG01006045.1/~~gb/GECG01006045.1/.p1  ORF type:complete len:221 (+),score=35.41 gb/GECG01006045.1/:1-663(+)